MSPSVYLHSRELKNFGTTTLVQLVTEWEGKRAQKNTLKQEILICKN